MKNIIMIFAVCAAITVASCSSEGTPATTTVDSTKVAVDTVKVDTAAVKVDTAKAGEVKAVK